MTEKAVLQWIKTNLAPLMPDHPRYTKDWLAGITMRETGILIIKFSAAFPVAEIHAKMRGDYGKRKGELDPQYHGYGYTQMDTGSYPEFIASGDWKDPVKVFIKTVSVLEEKRAYLEPRIGNLKPEVLDRAITAAYNCGQGNVWKAFQAKKDIDIYTYNHDYSKEVWRFREIYRSL